VDLSFRTSLLIFESPRHTGVRNSLCAEFSVDAEVLANYD